MSREYVVAIELADGGSGKTIADVARRLGAPLVRFWGTPEIPLDLPPAVQMIHVRFSAKTLPSAVETVYRLRPHVICPIVAVAEGPVENCEQSLTDAGADLFLVGSQVTAETYLHVVAVPEELRVGELVLHPEHAEAFIGVHRLPLTPNQFRLLETLVRARGRMVSPQVLIRWASGYLATDSDARKIAKVHISRLRFRLAAAGAGTPQIVAVRGFGYRLAPPSAAANGLDAIE